MTTQSPTVTSAKFAAAIFSALLILAIPDTSLGKRKEKFQTHPVAPEKELLIIAPAVVDSAYATYPGAFSFGHLMKELAGARDVSEVVLEWLESWETDQLRNRTRAVH